MTVVDSSVWIDLLTGRQSFQAAWLRAALGEIDVALTDLILCEVLRGFHTRSEFNSARWELRAHTVFNTGGEDIAIAAAENYRELRARGYTVRTLAGCIIATFCILNDHTLLHRDRDFQGFEKHLGLRVIQPR